MQKSILFMMLITLIISACSDGDEDCCNEEPRGWACVSVLDQWDKPMTDCVYRYSFPASTEGFEGDEQCAENEPDCTEEKRQCDEGELLIVGRPDNYRVDAECGDLFGHVIVPLDEGENPTYSSRLVGSLCYDESSPIELDPKHKKATLSDVLGNSSDTRCENWFDYHDTYRTEIVSIRLDCPAESDDCNPNTGTNYLAVTGKTGTISGGWPTNLDVMGIVENVPSGQTVTVIVTVRQLDDPEQELEIPVNIRSSVCGNGIVELEEQCEGTEVNSACYRFGFDAGEVVCTNCRVDISDCYNE